MKRNLNLEKIIIDEYENGVNNKELCQKYNKSRSYVQKVLVRHGIKLRNGSDVTKKYNVNENYFNNIDSDDKAYILGLLYSDGNVSGNVVKINLIETDKQILFDIAKRIYVDNNFQITYLKSRNKKWKNGGDYITKPQFLLTITRKKIVDDLKKYGLNEKKSFNIRFPEIKKKYYSNFVRGYFDGDGCFYSSKKYRNNNRIMIVSNNNFINELKTVIENELDIQCVIKNSNVLNINRLYIYGNVKVKKFLDWIYRDAVLKIERKFQHYINQY